VKLESGAHVFYAFGFALKSGCDNSDDGNHDDDGSHVGDDGDDDNQFVTIMCVCFCVFVRFWT
jgi:hypothetical protein